MRFLILSAAYCLSLQVWAQAPAFIKPDYKEIEKTIKDPHSELNYSKLFDRYIFSDTSLNEEHYKHLYYGYIYHKDYSPNATSIYTDSLQIIMQKTPLEREDYVSIIRLENLILHDTPFSLRDLNLLANMYYKLGDLLSTKTTDYKLNMLLKTILASGTGKNEQEGWHVISISHEYDIIHALGYKFSGSHTMTANRCDFLELAKNPDKIRGFYFDVNMIFEKQAQLFEK